MWSDGCLSSRPPQSTVGHLLHSDRETPDPALGSGGYVDIVNPDAGAADDL